MKKLLLLIAFVLTAIHSWAGESGTWGDSNGDNVTNTTDLMAIVHYIVGRPDANIDAQTADVNGDGKVDVSDVVSVVNRIVKGSKTVTVASAPQDTIHYMSAEEEKVISLPIPATSIQPMLKEFMSDKDQPENRVFYLEGGKEYFLNGRLSVCKGFTLQTNPEDIAAGKGRAKVYLYHGSLLSGENYTYVFFYMGHSPYEGEETLTPIAIDRLELKDIDFSVPLARNIGDGSDVPGIYPSANIVMVQALLQRIFISKTVPSRDSPLDFSAFKAQKFLASRISPLTMWTSTTEAILIPAAGGITSSMLIRKLMPTTTSGRTSS